MYPCSERLKCPCLHPLKIKWLLPYGKKSSKPFKFDKHINQGTVVPLKYN